MYCGKTYVGDYPSFNAIAGEEESFLVNAVIPGSYTLQDGTTLQILTESGSYVLSNGVIVLSDEDAALADAGLLDPYELVESVTTPADPEHITE